MELRQPPSWNCLSQFSLGKKPPSPFLSTSYMHLVRLITTCMFVRMRWSWYVLVYHGMIFILLYCGMLIWVHLDALILIARVLYDVSCCLLTELDDLSFSLHFMCASYELYVYIVLSYNMPSLLWCNLLFMLFHVLFETSLQSRSHDACCYLWLGHFC